MSTRAIRIVIDAAPEAVFRTLCDFTGYPQWNPSLRIDGDAVENALVKLRRRRPAALFGARYRIESLRSHERLVLRKETGFPRWASCNKETLLYTCADGTTLYICKLTVSGAIGALLDALPGQPLLRLLKAEARALKHYCENRVAATHDSA